MFTRKTNGAARQQSAIRAAVESVECRQLFATPTAFTGFYTQNFDGLDSQTATITVGALNTNYDLEAINANLAGWQVAKAGGSGASISLAKNNGSTNAGGLFNYGSTSDRALGSLGSGSQFGRYGAVFTNTTGAAISEFTLSFTAEQWRVGGTTAELSTFGYKLGATSISDTTGFVGNAALNLTTIGAVGATAAKTATITGINWLPGQTLALRWQDADSSGSDDGLAVDNLTLTAPTGPISAPGTLTVSPGSVTVNEDAGTVTFTVDRVGGTLGTVSADVLLTAGTATAGGDYGTPSIATITFANGVSTAQTFTIPIVDNDIYEIKEQFSVGLTNAQGTNGAPTLGSNSIVTIVDDETPFFKESFESLPGTTYTLKGPLTSTDNFQYFNRFSGPDTTNGARDDFTGGFDQSFAIQGQNHSGIGFGEGADATRTVSIPNIDIAGREDLSVFMSLGALASEPAFQNWALADGISIYATIDGGERVLIGQFKASNIKGDLKQDTDLDFLGDGVTLTAGNLQEFAFAIPGTGSSLTIDVDVTSTASFESWALDNVRVDGALAESTLPAWVAPGSLATWDAGSKTLTVTGAATIIADPDTDAPNVVASGAAAVLTIAPTTDRIIHLGGVTLSDNADIVVSSVAGRSHENHVAVVVGAIGGGAPAFSIASASGSFFDLNDNDLIVRSGSLSAVTGLLSTGRNAAPGGLFDGSWDGNGLRSSAANSVFSNLGIEQNVLAGARNGDLLFGAYANWTVGGESEALSENDIIVKYTYAGDFTLSGAVDDAASAVFSTFYDGGALSNNSWVTGDLNFDGKVDDTDSTVFSTLFGTGSAGNSLPQL